MHAATGFDEFSDVNFILTSGERIYNIERLFNIREGFSRKDDYLPERFIKESLPTGPCKGQTFEMDELLDDYYAIRGWDPNGIPTMEKMEELGLTAEAEEMLTK